MTPGSCGGAWPLGSHRRPGNSLYAGKLRVDGGGARLVVGSVPKLWGTVVCDGRGWGQQFIDTSYLVLGDKTERQSRISWVSLSREHLTHVSEFHGLLLHRACYSK